jgi:ligand-binding sensor domain-containing protein
MNGFNRRFTEGPGADVGHVFESTDGGTTWTNADGNFPDVPSSSVKVLGDGSLVVGTDLGMVYRAADSTTWQRLGTNFPVTVVLDVELGPDNNLYAATHGRGIWRIASPAAAAAKKK